MDLCVHTQISFSWPVLVAISHPMFFSWEFGLEMEWRGSLSAFFAHASVKGGDKTLALYELTARKDTQTGQDGTLLTWE